VRSVVLLLVVFAFAACEDDVLIETPPVMQIGTERLEFGAVAVGRSASQSVTVLNAGSGILKLALPEIEEGAEAFSATLGEQEIDPAGQAVITVTFAPPAIGRFEGKLLIKGNDPKTPALRISLGGDGYRKGALEVEPHLVDFGLVNAGQVADGKITVRNVGNGELLVTDISLEPGTSPDFYILSSTKPGELPAGAEALVRLAYRPGLQSLPPEEGALLVRAADPLNPEVRVRLLARLNRAPVADAGPDIDVDPLSEVQLDGSRSYDPDGNEPLTFSWALVRRPDGSGADLLGADGARPLLVPDLVGLYEAELWVTDSTGLRSLLPDRVTVKAVPAEKLLVELVWDSPVADLDLHFIAPGGDFGSALDCYWANQNPDWGVAGEGADDPELRRDDLAGFGPEVLVYQKPIDGLYQLQVHFYAAHTPSGREPTTATVRIFIDGLLAGEISRRLEEQSQRWLAATIQWPEGVVVGQDVLLE